MARSSRHNRQELNYVVMPRAAGVIAAAAEVQRGAEESVGTARGGEGRHCDIERDACRWADRWPGNSEVSGRGHHVDAGLGADGDGAVRRVGGGQRLAAAQRLQGGSEGVAAVVTGGEGVGSRQARQAPSVTKG